MIVRLATRLFAYMVLAAAAATASAEGGSFGGRAEAGHSPLTQLVRARSRAIEAAFPGFLEISDFKLAIAPAKECPKPATYLACYDAEQNTLTFFREVHSAADARLLEIADDYWVFYEHAVLRDAFPIIGIIDGA